MDVTKVLEHFENNKKQYLEDLKDLVKIPSVSFDGFDPQNVRKSAQAVADLFKRVGLENIEILDLGPGVHPYVYADWLHAPNAPTVLLYAHHDVQPPGRENVWKSPAFVPTERDGRLYGRGTADDKAGVTVHTSAIESYLKVHGKLPINIKLIIEGEEEVGSHHLAQFMKKYSSKLKADCMILTDTQNYDVGLPALTVSLRGLIGFEIECRALKSPKHSGMVGGPVPDVAMALNKILASMVDSDGRVSIPGIWDEVKKVTTQEADAYKLLPFTVDEFRAQSDLLPNTKLLNSSDGTFKPFVQMWREPSLAVNAMEASSRKQASNSILDSVWAKFGIRIVADMNPERTARLVEEHIQKVTPWGVEVKLKADIGGKAWSCEAKGPAFESAMNALEKGYGRKPVLMGCGGSIPFVEPLSDALGGIPALLIGVEDPYTNAHSENESMVIADYEKCIRSAIHFYSLYKK